MSNMAETTAMPVEDVKSIRAALQLVLGTHKGNSKQALAAIGKGWEAYRLCFTTEERQRVLEAGQAMQNGAPEGHFMRQVPQMSTFEQVLEELGTQFAEEVLGKPAEK